MTRNKKIIPEKKTKAAKSNFLINNLLIINKYKEGILIMNQVNKSKTLIILISLLVFLFFAGIYGCNENTTQPSAENVDLSLTGSLLSSNPSILELDEVKILIKDIKLNVANTENDEHNFKTGPYVLLLNLNSGINPIGASYIPIGTYDKIKFEIHKLNNNELSPDPEFTDANGRYSVIVKGWYNGVYFIYKSAKSAHQKLTFPSRLFVGEGGKSNITLKAIPYLWFVKNGDILDPMNEANRNDIDNNIKDNVNENFKIFVDNDRNGLPD